MKKILIADASKASLVMTSEVFKDHFPGVQVIVARNSSEAIEAAKREEHIDAFVIDFHLPDKNGAYTAARIKKLFPVPVLITAFDNPDVQEAIEKHCSAYDDCLSWLAKPVNAELVVSIAQRFVEGSYRTQRRVDCMIPGIAEFGVQLKGAKRKAKAATDEESGPATEKVCLPVMVEDCSVGGFKFRLMNKQMEQKSPIKFDSRGNLNIEKSLTIFLPSFENIQTGEDNVGYWLWGESEEKRGKKSKETSKKPTLSALKRSTRKNISDRSQEGQAIKGKSIWITKLPDGDALIGVRSDNLILSKKLFESVLLGENKRTGVIGGLPRDNDEEAIETAEAEPSAAEASEEMEASAKPQVATKSGKKTATSRKTALEKEEKKAPSRKAAEAKSSSKSASTTTKKAKSKATNSPTSAKPKAPAKTNAAKNGSKSKKPSKVTSLTAAKAKKASKASPAAKKTTADSRKKAKPRRSSTRAS